MMKFFILTATLRVYKVQNEYSEIGRRVEISEMIELEYLNII